MLAFADKMGLGAFGYPVISLLCFLDSVLQEYICLRNFLFLYVHFGWETFVLKHL